MRIGVNRGSLIISSTVMLARDDSSLKSTSKRIARFQVQG